MAEQPQQRALDLLNSRITTMQSEVLKAEDKVAITDACANRLLPTGLRPPTVRAPPRPSWLNSPPAAYDSFARRRCCLHSQLYEYETQYLQADYTNCGSVLRVRLPSPLPGLQALPAPTSGEC